MRLDMFDVKLAPSRLSCELSVSNVLVLYWQVWFIVLPLTDVMLTISARFMLARTGLVATSSSKRLSCGPLNVLSKAACCYIGWSELNPTVKLRLC